MSNPTAATIHNVATTIPDSVAANCRKSPERMAWLEGLPSTVQELRRRWELTPDSPLSGEEPSCSYVEGVRRGDGAPAVLKISMPHMEQEHEAEGLRFWNGHPTVRLLKSDEGLVREGLRVFKELAYTATADVLLATDLHAGNVLRAEREPWLVIDPKPFLGDPAFDATQHLFNCWPRLRSNPDRTIRKFADQLGVDHERVRSWTFARIAAEPRDDWTTNEQTELARRIAP